VATHGLSDQVKLIATSAKDIDDMGDPLGCTSHMPQILKSDGTWMIVEPIAGERPLDQVVAKV
jgi:hypothetical protein